MDADDMIGEGGGIGGAAESSAVESSDSAREGFPFAVATAAAGTAGQPGSLHRGEGSPAQGARQSRGLVELRRRAPRRKWRKSPNCNNRPAKTPKTAERAGEKQLTHDHWSYDQY